MRTQTISSDDLRRNFGEVKKKLPFVEFIITDRGNPIGILKSTPQIKKRMMKQTAGAFKNTELDDDTLWDEVLKKSSRKTDVTL